MAALMGVHKLRHKHQTTRNATYTASIDKVAYNFSNNNIVIVTSQPSNQTPIP